MAFYQSSSGPQPNVNLALFDERVGRTIHSALDHITRKYNAAFSTKTHLQSALNQIKQKSSAEFTTKAHLNSELKNVRMEFSHEGVKLKKDLEDRYKELASDVKAIIDGIQARTSEREATASLFPVPKQPAVGTHSVPVEQGQESTNITGTDEPGVTQSNTINQPVPPPAATYPVVEGGARVCVAVDGLIQAMEVTKEATSEWIHALQQGTRTILGAGTPEEQVLPQAIMGSSQHQGQVNTCPTPVEEGYTTTSTTQMIPEFGCPPGVTLVASQEYQQQVEQEDAAGATKRGVESSNQGLIPCQASRTAKGDSGSALRHATKMEKRHVGDRMRGCLQDDGKGGKERRGLRRCINGREVRGRVRRSARIAKQQ